MAALTASCIDLNIQGNGAYSVLKQLATIALQNGFITDSHQGNDSNLLIVFYVQIMPDDFVMQLHRF